MKTSNGEKFGVDRHNGYIRRPPIPDNSLAYNLSEGDTSVKKWAGRGAVTGWRWESMLMKPKEEKKNGTNLSTVHNLEKSIGSGCSCAYQRRTRGWYVCYLISKWGFAYLLLFVDSWPPLDCLQFSFVSFESFGIRQPCRSLSRYSTILLDIDELVRLEDINVVVGIFDSKALDKSILMSNDSALVFGLLFGLFELLRGSIQLEGDVEEHAGLNDTTALS